ncbi:uncharacterized protein LOC122004937 [Zingiber officinale]|uniref:uncharacterized protein LOC122004937 n=1 Tax=Zingiber officinale TaxID=94328 RepID=UPI001C4C48FC|nr:uncharacterized protein LOC122004937 [Zingiber officinale]
MARFLSAGALAGALASSSGLVVNRSCVSVVLGLRRFSSRHEKVQLFELEIDGEGSASEVEVLGMRRLEDAIRAVIVRRSAPDWLPFVPGSSYWVPPRSNPIADEKMMPSIAARGSPSAAYFYEGTPLHSRKKTQERTNAQSEDDEES